MRMSCNGCRVLRKGCSEDCTIRPCLEWFKSPEAQSNATLFLAKFYGRAGLLNLLNAGEQHSRPAIFKSLLYEACGRIANPINGATGLLCSGNWHLCQAAVEAVLRGASVAPLSPELASTMMIPPFFQAGDIRHVAKDDHLALAQVARGVHEVKTRGQHKNDAGKSKVRAESPDDDVSAALVMWSWSHEREEVRVPSSHGSGGSLGELTNMAAFGSGEDDNAAASAAETGDASITDGSGIELELTLGIEPVGKKIKVGP